MIESQCLENPYAILTVLNSFKLRIQQSKFLEQKFVHLFHISILIEMIIPFLRKNAQNNDHSAAKGFFIRDLTHFFCNSIMSEEFTCRLKMATCHYFLSFCQQILPGCAKEINSSLNNIVSAVVPVIKMNESPKLTNVSLELLKFLVVEQTACLKEGIASLDNFPSQEVFENIRKVHLNAKYNGREFSLVEEIEYFLKVEKRKIEGLISLKNHVRTWTISNYASNRANIL